MREIEQRTRGVHLGCEVVGGRPVRRGRRRVQGAHSSSHLRGHDRRDNPCQQVVQGLPGQGGQHDRAAGLVPLGDLGGREAGDGGGRAHPADELGGPARTHDLGVDVPIAALVPHDRAPLGAVHDKLGPACDEVGQSRQSPVGPVVLEHQAGPEALDAAGGGVGDPRGLGGIVDPLTDDPLPVGAP